MVLCSGCWIKSWMIWPQVNWRWPKGVGANRTKLMITQAIRIGIASRKVVASTCDGWSVVVFVFCSCFQRFQEVRYFKKLQYDTRSCKSSSGFIVVLLCAAEFVSLIDLKILEGLVQCMAMFSLNLCLFSSLVFSLFFLCMCVCMFFMCSKRQL